MLEFPFLCSKHSTFSKTFIKTILHIEIGTKINIQMNIITSTESKLTWLVHMLNIYKRCVLQAIKIRKFTYLIHFYASYHLSPTHAYRKNQPFGTFVNTKCNLALLI